MAPATEHSNGKKTMDFTPVDYDVHNLPAEAPEGQWTAVVKDVVITATSKDNYPMLRVMWKLEEADDDDNKKWEGTTLSTFLTFFPDSHRAGRISKQRVRGYCKSLDIDMEVIPSRISSKSDLEELAEAMKGQRVTVWTKHSSREVDGENVTSVDVSLSKPGGDKASTPKGGGSLFKGSKKRAEMRDPDAIDDEGEDVDDDEEDDEEEAPKMVAKSKLSPATKKARNR